MDAQGLFDGNQSMRNKLVSHTGTITAAEIDLAIHKRRVARNYT